MLGQLAKALSGFFAWWFGELAALVPPPLRGAVSRSWDRLVLEHRETEVVVGRETRTSYREVGRVDTSAQASGYVREAVVRLARKAGAKRADTVVRLPSSQVLERTVRLPLAAEENLRGVLAFEMDRHTPYRVDDVYYDFRIRDRDAEAQLIEVELVVAPRGVVDAAVERATDWGFEPVAVDVSGDSASRDGTLNLLPQERDGAAGQTVGGFTLLLATAIAILLAVAVYIPVDAAKREAGALMVQVADAKAEAEAAIRLRKELDRFIEVRAFLADKKRDAPRAINVLNELTQILPDDTWLLQLQLRGSAVQFAGYSGSASAIIGIVEESPMFRNGQFRSIVAQDAKVGLERFNISAELEQGRDG